MLMDKMLKTYSASLHPGNLEEITRRSKPGNNTLKEQCHEEFAVLGQFCAKPLF